MLYVYTYVSLLSIALLFIANSPVKAEIQADTPSPALSHFNGLHTLSGASYRAFKNRLKRQMRGENCLRYHVTGTWWHYEWCIDQHVRQFHPLPKGQKTKDQSIILGLYETEKPQPLRVLAVDNLARLTDPDRMGYMAQQRYNAGDFLEEKSPCEYEMNVCSPVACGLMQRDQFVLTAPTFMEEDERNALTRTVRDMFYHAYNGYLTHAFPQDDLLPLSCRGGEFELGRLPMLTLIDTLDTLALLEDATEFRRAVGLVVENANFDLDTEVSVFETTIRLLGGLLSAHLFAVNTDLKLYPEGDYNGALLRLAVNLGDRLMPAFNTVTGIPYGTVNLKYGVPKGETPIASTAGAGSLSIEFTMLSVLTGEPRYAAASRGAMRKVVARTSRCSPPVPSPVALIKASKSATEKNAMTLPEKIAMAASDNAKPTTTVEEKVKKVDTESVASDVLQEWLPALEEKLRKIGGKSVEDKWLEELLDESSLGSTNHHQPISEQGAQDHVVQYLYGGSQLGDFRVDQIPGRLRVTREETGDWIEASGVLDASHMIIGMGFSDGSDDDADADSYTFDESKHDKVEHIDDYHPPYLSWNHVYKVNEDLSLPVDQRCSLRVQVGYTPYPGELQHNAKGKPHVGDDIKGKPNVWLTVPCVGAGFGVTDTFKASRAFPNMELVVADPIDACSEVSNLSEDSIRGKIVLVQRGECYFEMKARNAAKWGAAGVIVVNTENDDLVMVMGGLEENSADATDEPLDVPVVMVPQRLGEWFETRLAESEASSLSPVKKI
ncbi:ER degradation-enhancing alpha-mannosidase-like protein [Phytophthora palmivora]|uniref:alpha-1,2-Mannosidase n=1 Tax=Phytophthora palmivora TaxID=4796 RepID=A0A2P4XT82_9STRA|nr:ER degradation-enhancing alpha-mannosidase-like protein [Phytophthora palmivora]